MGMLTRSSWSGSSRTARFTVLSQESGEIWTVMDGKPDRGHVRVGPLNPVPLVRRKQKVVTSPQLPRLCLTLDQQPRRA